MNRKRKSENSDYILNNIKTDRSYNNSKMRNSL